MECTQGLKVLRSKCDTPPERTQDLRDASGLSLDHQSLIRYQWKSGSQEVILKEGELDSLKRAKLGQIIQNLD